MSGKIVLLFLSAILISSGASVAQYDQLVSEVINFEVIKTKLEGALGDIHEDDLVKLQQLDASTKFIPSGLAAGNWMDLGHFDECYGIHYGDLYGKYCLGTIAVGLQNGKIFGHNATIKRPMVNPHPQPRLIGLGADYAGIHFAVCLLSNTSASAFPGLNEDFCYSKATEPELSAGAIATIVILSVVLFLAAVSTAFDVWLYFTEREAPHELMIAFSFLSNGRKIFKSTSNPDQLLCLNGIKAISMMWVVISHGYTLAMFLPLYNFFAVLEWQQNSANMFIMGATVSVDTFFVVGGLVTAYTFLKSMDKGVKFNVILYYVHRYLRLTPAFGIVILIHMYLLNYLGNGPLWKIVDMSLVETCKESVWGSLFYVANYVRKGNCVPQTWYLSVDMQLFILSPLVLIPLQKWPRIGLGSLGVLAVLGCVVPFIIAYTMDLGSMMGTNSTEYMMEYYMQTYTRFGPYVMGMILGYYLYQIKKSSGIRLNKWVVSALWLVSLTGLVACVYAGYPLMVETKPDLWGESMFTTFDRPAWSLALCGLIFLCVAGYGGPIDMFLSLPIFQFLTKLSYSMYLVHYAVITVKYSSIKTTMKFSNLMMFHNFWGDFMFTLVLSLILCLLFESPIIILEKYLFGRGRPKRVEKKPEV